MLKLLIRYWYRILHCGSYAALDWMFCRSFNTSDRTDALPRSCPELRILLMNFWIIYWPT